MSLHHSTARCDWCRSFIEDHEDVACKLCYEKLEIYISDLEKQVSSLRGEVKELEEKGKE